MGKLVLCLHDTRLACVKNISLYYVLELVQLSSIIFFLYPNMSAHFVFRGVN